MPSRAMGNPPAGAGQSGAAGGPRSGMGAGKTSAENGEGKKTDYRFRLYTENTTLLVTALVDFSRANALQLNILNVRAPSLEDAFVRLTEEKSHAK